MRIARIVFVCLFLAFSRASAADDAVTTLGKRAFKFPVAVEGTPRDTLQEFRLYASEDEGRTWNLVAMAPAASDFIPYTAPRDGMYWFAIQVVRKDGKKFPDNLADIVKPEYAQYVQKVRVVT